MEAEKLRNPNILLLKLYYVVKNSNLTETIFHKIVLFMYSKSRNLATLGFINI